MAIQWMYESSDRRDEPVSSARIIQLTSAAAISKSIYGEQPYASPDGKQIIIARIAEDFVFPAASPTTIETPLRGDVP